MPLAGVFGEGDEDSEPDDYEGDDYYVVYNPGTPPGEINGTFNDTTSPQSVTVKYDGVAVAEYNPQFWTDYRIEKPTDNGSNYNWTIQSGGLVGTPVNSNGGVSNWFKIESYGAGTIVFTGWTFADRGGNPTEGVIDPGDRLETEQFHDENGRKVLNLVATWDSVRKVTYVGKAEDAVHKDYENADSNGLNRYNNLVIVVGSHSIVGQSIGGCTVRGIDGNAVLEIATTSGSSGLNGDTIIDNVKLVGGDDEKSFGSAKALYANGHKLIIGTGVVRNYEGPNLNPNPNKAIQIYGGVAEGFNDPNGKTDVAIFSGVYSNVIAGPYGSPSAGDKYVNWDETDLRILGGWYLSRIYGGTQKPLWGANPMSWDAGVVRETNILMVGGVFENEHNGNLTENIVGGSRFGIVQESNVEISGRARVSIVQGGGVAGCSETDVTNVRISGRAVVNGAICGSTTDGNGSGDPNVEETFVIITGGAEVHDVYGGGMDTFAEPIGPSAQRTNVTIEGNCVVEGSVYGGGLRGSVGSRTGEAPNQIQKDEIVTKVQINGGTIKGSVYGGGSGGADNQNKNTSLTGKAYVRGGTSVSVTSGVVNGNVYGGGKGVDIVELFSRLEHYYDPSKKDDGTVYGLSFADMDQGPGGTPTGNPDGNVKWIGVYRDVATVIGDVHVEISGGEIRGDVFGAGKGFEKKTLTDSEIDGIINSVKPSIVGGVVYDWQKTAIRAIQNQDLSMVAGVKGDVVMNISGGTVDGSVYGAGENGKLEDGRFGGVDQDGNNIDRDTFCPSDPKTVELNLGSVTIGGDVFGGGLGSNGVLSTYLTDRTINIDGATIGGSVYGGSKLGYDNCRQPDSAKPIEYLGNSPGAAHINIVSGSIASGRSGNVYGGGYSGHSYFNSTINIGVPAAEALNVEPSGSISIGSVFGGPNVGVRQTGSSADETVLMKGDVYIDIGGKGGIGQVYNSFTITGDVFGGGDYCKVDGMKTVSFDGFDQGDVKMLSIQKVDDLVITDSHIRLAGNVDGSSAVGSNRMSLNRVGMMTLASVGSRSIVEMDYAARSISGYASTYVSEPEDPRDYNLLRVNNGKTFFILGEDNTGNDGNGELMGDIRGKTLFESDSNDYFGAFIIGQLSSVKEGTGFWIINGGDVAEARTTDYDRSSNGTDDTRAWFLSGAFSVEKTVLFDNAGNDDTQTLKSGDVDFILPKIVSDSKIRYTGYHLELNSPGSLGIDPNMGKPGSGLKLMFGLPGSNALTFGNEGGLELSGAGIGSESSDEGMNLYASVEVRAGFTVSGYAGTVVLHFAEIKDGIALGIFDVRVLVYLRVSQNVTDMTVPVIMRPNGSSGYSGTADIYLPALDQNAVGTYKITSVSGLGSGNSLVLNTVSNNLGKDGWLDAYLRPGTEDHKVGADFEDRSIELGTGAVYSPVLRVGYDAGAPGGFNEVTMSLAVCGQNGDTVEVISVKLLPKEVSVQKVTFKDKVLGNNGVWEKYIDLFTVDVEFGTSISKNYVAYKVSAENNNTDATSFIQSINGLLLKNGDNVRVSTVRENIEEAIGAAGGGYVSITIEDLLNRIIEKKPDTMFSFSEAGDKNTYDYSVNTPSWNNGKLGLSRFNFERPITVGQNVYSAYGVSVVLKAVKDGNLVDGYLSPDIIHPVLDKNSGQVTLNPGEWLVNVKPGYEIKGWYFDQACTKLLESERVYSSVTVYAKLEPIHYTIEVTVTEEGSTSSKTPTVNGLSKDESGQEYYTVESELSITVDLAGGYHISDVSTNTDLETEFRYTVDGGHVELTPPPAVKDASRKLVVMIDLSQRFIVTITLPDDGHSDNGMFGLTETQNGSSAPAVTENGTEKSFSFKVENGGSFVMNAPNGSKISLYGTTLIDSAYQDGITVTGISADTAYRLYVTNDWSVTYGSGYTHTVKHLSDPLGSTHSADNDATVHAGDVIELKLDDDHVFGPSFACTGAVWDRVSTDPRVYTVSGGMDVVFVDAVKKTYTVNVTFIFENAPTEVYGSAHVMLQSQLQSVIKVNGYATDRFTGSFSASNQSYMIEAGFFGYENSSTIVDPASIADSTSETGVVSANVTITLSPVVLDVVFMDGDSKLHTRVWSLPGNETISELYTGASGYWMWSTGSYFLENDETIDLGKFPQKEFYRNDMPLVLYAVPYLKDMTPAEYRESVTVILVTGDLNGQHVLNKAVPEIDGTLSVGGSSVDVKTEAIGGSSILTIRGCPDGTGALQVITDELVVLIVSVLEFEDVS